MFTLPRLDESEMEHNAEGTREASGFGALQTKVGNLPLKQLDYRTRIVGLAIHTTIAQTYYNPFDECIEATYIFPLEGEQAVTACEMWIGTRVVRAQLKERGQARADYRRAIASGYRATLLEENRPETFAMKVGNIAPGEAVQVRIYTVGHLPVVDGEWTLRIPLVVAPRYTSGIALPGVSAGDGAALDTDQVPDASAVTPPTWLPGFASPVDLKLEVHVKPGSLATQPEWPTLIRSSLHAVLTEVNTERAGEPTSCCVRIHPGERVDRDFILRGSYAGSSIAAAIVVEPFRELADSLPSQSPTDDRSTFAVQFVPPPLDAKAPRDIVFLLDRSGSMDGWKMDAARRGISRLIDSLSSGDRFQVLAFDDTVESPEFAERDAKDGQQRKRNRGGSTLWIEANDHNRYEATRWLAKIDARGGTEMGKALNDAINNFVATKLSTAETVLRSRAIVLVTDGQITGEDSLIRLLGKFPESQRPRMFCLGIDRAVNGSVIQRLTKLSGGSYELVESQQRLDEVLQRFAADIGSPALTDLELISDQGSDALQWVPRSAQTLYAGRATSIYGRVDSAKPLELTVRGRLASGKLWETSFSVPAQARSTCGVAAANGVTDEFPPTLLPLWARGRIRELEDTWVSQPNQDTSLKEQIIACSLGSQVLSRFTAFVAVDESEKVNVEGRVHKVIHPVQFPDGWEPTALHAIDPSQLIPMPGKSSQPVSANGEVRRTGLLAMPPKFKSHILRQGVVSAEQYSESLAIAKRSGKPVYEVLLESRYASLAQIAQVTALSYRLPYVDLEHASLEEGVTELVPESVARENVIMPLATSQKSLTIAMSDPSDSETVEKLRFILDRNIDIVVASRESIQRAINEHYGQVEGESVDSMLQEFTDTAIDFPAASCDPGQGDMSFFCLDDDLDAVPPSSGVLPCQVHFSPIFSSSPPRPISDLSFSPSRPISRLRDAFARLLGRGSGRGADKGRGNGSGKLNPAQVVRLIEELLAEAKSQQASHLILRSEQGSLHVFFIIAGQEVYQDQIPASFTTSLVTRLKVLCNMDVTSTKPLESGRCCIREEDPGEECAVHFRETEQGISILIEFSVTPISASPDAVKSWWEANA